MTNFPFWTDQTSVLLTSFWGWSPETWGTLSFSSKGRRDNLAKSLSDPFIVVIYVTSNKSTIDRTLKNMVAGFYLVSHEKGDRDIFTHPIHHQRDPKSWRHGFSATRAFTYFPEYRISIDDFDPSLKKEKRFRAVATYGEMVTDGTKINRLRDIPFEEVDVYQPLGSSPELPPFDPLGDGSENGYVRGGPDRRSGYTVPDKDPKLPRSLYVLRLRGNTSAFLGEPAGNRSIFKIGLSVSPELRRQLFQRALPEGAFGWNLHRSTMDDGHEAYSSFEAVKFGEFQMKVFLAKHGKWLGGEFYAASEEAIVEAWRIGREAALSKMGN
jgi:hypothetical protein